MGITFFSFSGSQFPSPTQADVFHADSIPSVEIGKTLKKRGRPTESTADGPYGTPPWSICAVCPEATVLYHVVHGVAQWPPRTWTRQDQRETRATRSTGSTSGRQQLTINPLATSSARPQLDLRPHPTSARSKR